MMGFLVNTRIRKYVINNTDLFACQVPIKAADHSCLDHDSYIDCSDLKEFDDDQLSDERDKIDKEVVQKVKRAVRKAKTIERRYKKLITGD
jgi:hypothetical protein